MPKLKPVTGDCISDERVYAVLNEQQETIWEPGSADDGE